MTLPNFFVIGAGKAGTTSLHQYLDQHPYVYMSPVKETNFFALEGEKPNFRGPEADQRINRWSVTGIEEYRALFEGVSGETAVGEASPLYLYDHKAPLRIKRRVPEAKLIAVLRDPVERAYSAFLHTTRSGREKLGFTKALREEEDRIRANWEWIWHYKNAGFYHEQLSRYYETFEREQIRVYLHEDLSTDPAGVMRDIFGFLGVDDSFAPDTSRRRNVRGIPKSRALFALTHKPNRVKTLVKALVPEGPWRKISMGIKSRNLAGTPPLPEDVAEELAVAFREDVSRLQGLVGRDLSAWLR
jgi:hypothetical protein